MAFITPAFTAGNLLVMLLFAVTPALQANEVVKLELSAPPGFDHAAVIKVESSDGESWSKADTNYVTGITANFGAKCKDEGKSNNAYQGLYTVSGFQGVGKTSPVNFRIPQAKKVAGNFKYHNPASIDPVKACNDELNNKVATDTDLTLARQYRKYRFLAAGFKLKLLHVIEASYLLTCNATGLGFADFAEESTYLHAIVDCQPSALARKKLAGLPED